MLYIPISIAVATVLWYTLPINTLTVALLILQILLFVLYSAPPFRLKELWVGIIVDALYSRVVPVLTVLSLLEFSEIQTMIIPVAIWMLLTGIRNIISHQLDDIDSDRRSSTSTWASRSNTNRILSYIYRFLIPAEIISVLISLVFLSQMIPKLYLSVPIFVLFLMVRYKVWPEDPGSLKEWKGRSMFLLNDFYADFLPLVLLALIGSGKPILLFGILIHLLLFPSVFRKYRQQASIMWTSRPHYYMLIYYTLKHGLYSVVRRSFLLFGVDLRKEGITVLDHLRKWWSGKMRT